MLGGGLPGVAEGVSFAGGVGMDAEGLGASVDFGLAGATGPGGGLGCVACGLQGLVAFAACVMVAGLCELPAACPGGPWCAWRLGRGRPGWLFRRRG
jgi:hypothetical protein